MPMLTYELNVFEMCELTNLFTRAEFDSRSIFFAEFNLFECKFSFSYIGYLTNADELTLPYCLPIAEG